MKQEHWMIIFVQDKICIEIDRLIIISQTQLLRWIGYFKSTPLKQILSRIMVGETNIESLRAHKSTFQESRENLLHLLTKRNHQKQLQFSALDHTHILVTLVTLKVFLVLWGVVYLIKLSFLSQKNKIAKGSSLAENVNIY